ncbi:MAG TPA: NADH-quinone oxidoreductase subunit L [Elusimicrobia bacterium]|nr:NADH-quinone oxidoreductase subunit L [Elusimicrobiota bacterium]HBT61952.1 NADH-quinone oxidoreductase subunit L [Elusimicrobiota bacterium]
MIEIPISVYLLFAAPLAALAIGFFILRPWRPQWTHVPILISCAVVTGCAASLSGVVFAGRGLDATLYHWMVAGEWGVPFGVRIDGVGVAVLCMVTLVGGLIHVYAVGYMKGDPGFSRFFLLFHFFYLAMIGLLVSNNYVQLYLFWELVGAASYLLIGFWFHKQAARRAALQAFLVNRAGDFGLMLAVLILLAMFRNTRFAMLYQVVAAVPQGVMALVALLIFWAATAKSAQFPLYFWLPDAMEGPTPVSALMHAATMVTAGIFLLIRSWPLIAAVPGMPGFIAVVGAGTAVMAALLAGTQKDLKRILAYSTVSHLGLMAFALGLGQVAAAVFHLVAHGFFKAALFLCAGNAAHGSGKSTLSVDEVGGLRRRMPLTYACFVAAALSLAGLWPLAGFFSKDAILDAAAHHGAAAYLAGLAIAAGGAFYIFRMLFLTFLGSRPEQKPGHAHEAPAAMAIPAVFLSLGALSVGWLGPGLVRILASGWPRQMPQPALPVLSLGVSAAGLGMAALGISAAYLWTMRFPSFDWDWRRRHPALEAAFANDLGWRWVAARCWSFARWTADRVGRVWDRDIWDAAVDSSAAFARRLADAGGGLATGSLSDSLWWLMTGAAVLLAWAGLR